MKASNDAEAPSESAHDAELNAALRRLQRLIWRYPFAAQALYSSLLNEGRQYRQTEEGKQWEERLRRSDVLRRARAVWDVTTLNMLEDDPEAIIPSKLLEAFVQASSKKSVESQLRSLFEEFLGSDDEER